MTAKNWLLIDTVDSTMYVPVDPTRNVYIAAPLLEYREVDCESLQLFQHVQGNVKLVCRSMGYPVRRQQNSWRRRFYRGIVHMRRKGSILWREVQESKYLHLYYRQLYINGLDTIKSTVTTSICLQNRPGASFAVRSLVCGLHSRE
jgi:hypothetical protein